MVVLADGYWSHYFEIVTKTVYTSTDYQLH